MLSYQTCKQATSISKSDKIMREDKKQTASNLHHVHGYQEALTHSTQISFHQRFSVLINYHEVQQTHWESASNGSAELVAKLPLPKALTHSTLFEI